MDPGKPELSWGQLSKIVMGTVKYLNFQRMSHKINPVAKTKPKEQNNPYTKHRKSSFPPSLKCKLLKEEELLSCYVMTGQMGWDTICISG